MKPKLPSQTEMIVLDLLRGKAGMAGLDMIRASNGVLGRGTIYVLLNRLEDQGLVRSSPGPRDADGLARRSYDVTDAGVRAAAAYRSACNGWA